jgi:hypothetical protein
MRKLCAALLSAEFEPIDLSMVSEYLDSLVKAGAVSLKR